MNLHSLSRLALASAIGAGALVAGGCATTQGNTVEEQRDFVMDTHDETLRDLYRQRPEAREKIENAPGYGVFSAIDTNVILLAGGGGYGVVVDNATGERTYMRMGEGGVGPGIGLKDTRMVLVFHNDQRLHEFTESGWEFGGSADAAATSGDQGGAAETRGTVTRDIEVYQLTDSGVSLQATLRGTRFWRDRELNQTRHSGNRSTLERDRDRDLDRDRNPDRDRDTRDNDGYN